MHISKTIAMTACAQSQRIGAILPEALLFVTRPTEIGAVSIPDGHSNQADDKGIEVLWIPWPGCAQPGD